MFAWIIAGSLVVGAPALKEKQADQSLYGEWESEEPARDEDGTPTGGRYRYRFSPDGTWQLLGRGPGRAKPRGFSFDPKANPPALDLEALGGSPKLTTLAVYRIEGDRLTICAAFPGKSRPEEFVDKPDGSGTVMRFRRVRPRD